jgi:hypothetical protein
MRTSRSSFVALVSAFAASLLVAAPARAATPPGNWSLAVERLFGLTRTSIDSDFGDASYTSISLLSKVVGQYGYSAPRFAFDYLIGSGVSFGGALGYQSLSEDNDTDAWLIAPRVGYFARLGRSFALWPRVGITELVVEYGDSDTATALTIEAPLEFFVSSGVAFTLTPHADIGLGGSENDVDRTLTEIGLQFGVNLFL